MLEDHKTNISLKCINGVNKNIQKLVSCKSSKTITTKNIIKDATNDEPACYSIGFMWGEAA